MKAVSVEDLKNLYIPPAASHKGQNGRLLVIGGSHLFHAASLWALTVASRIVDLVHYSSVPENNELILGIKEEFRNGIVVGRDHIEEYVMEDDCILIGPGMARAESEQISNIQHPISNISQLKDIKDEGLQTKALTDYLLKKYPEKQWVIDAGALQMMDISLIPKHAILTPHHGEFELLCNKSQIPNLNVQTIEMKVKVFAQTYNCIVLLKGQTDLACGGDGECRAIEGGNAGMTKGGTGDVLAGLIAALACKNNPFLATIAGSFINKKAGDELYQRVGPFFNATDLANQIPQTMKLILGL